MFTVPHTLHGLVAEQPRLIDHQLFAAAADTLTAFAADPPHRGGEASFTRVLHTCKHDVGRHVHVHARVAGGALRPAGQWRHAARGFLFAVRALSALFRGTCMAALTALRTAGQVPSVAADSAWRHLTAALYAHDWVVYAKQPLGGPTQVLEYVGRYTHRVALSNDRIIGSDRDEVLLRVRVNGASGRTRTMPLAAETFIARFLRHVLPSGFTRIRHYGVLAPAHKSKRLALARAALDVPRPDTALIESVAQFMQRVARRESGACPHCDNGHVVVIGPPLRAASTGGVVTGAAVRRMRMPDHRPSFACRVIHHSQGGWRALDAGRSFGSPKPWPEHCGGARILQRLRPNATVACPSPQALCLISRPPSLQSP